MTVKKLTRRGLLRLMVTGPTALVAGMYACSSGSGSGRKITPGQVVRHNGVEMVGFPMPEIGTDVVGLFWCN